MEIVKGNTTYDGFKEVDGKLVCENCGQSNKFKRTMHLDGKDFYTNVFQCKCGNTVSVISKRSKQDAMFWED